MVPADQRFAAGYAAGPDIDMRLVVQRELILGEGIGKIGSQRRAYVRDVFHPGLVPDGRVAAFGRNGECRVGAREHALEIVSVRRRDGDADARAARDPIRGPLIPARKRFRERPCIAAHARGEELGRDRRRYVDGKHVAADAADEFVGQGQA